MTCQWAGSGRAGSSLASHSFALGWTAPVISSSPLNSSRCSLELSWGKFICFLRHSSQEIVTLLFYLYSSSCLSTKFCHHCHLFLNLPLLSLSVSVQDCFWKVDFFNTVFFYLLGVLSKTWTCVLNLHPCGILWETSLPAALTFVWCRVLSTRTKLKQDSSAFSSSIFSLGLWRHTSLVDAS